MLLRALALTVCVMSGATAQDLTEILSTAGRELAKNVKVTGHRFNCVPADCRVRPFEPLVIQVLVDGEITRKDGSVAKGRLRLSPGKLTPVDPAGGWTSKPFKFQGQDPGGFLESSGGDLGRVLGSLGGEFTVFDSFLFIAPEKTGEHTLHCTTAGIRTEMKVIVDAGAASAVPAEQVSFGKEDRAGERFRSLAEHYAPMFAQETWWTPKADYLARFDFDGDLTGDNNWDNLEKGSSQAYVYYAVMETATHWFLIYNGFHPRDYSDKCMAGSCHENDNEGVIAAVLRDGSEHGRILAMQTLAHNSIRTYVHESVKAAPGAHSIAGRMRMESDSHPMVFIESGGHGMYGVEDPMYSRYRPEPDDFSGGIGVTYVYKGVAERPAHANARRVGYDLLPIEKHWWLHALNQQNQRMFDDFGPYQPLGGRPGIPVPQFGRTFLGRKFSSNKAKPFWGWHDTKTLKAGLLAAGQWALDPAYSFSKTVRFGSEMKWSLDYTYNPYLAAGERAPATDAAAAPQPPARQAPAPASGQVDVEVVVDGSVVLQVGGEAVSPETVSGQPLTNVKATFSAPAPAAAVEWKLEKRAGRGEAKIVEQPSEANGYRLKIRVDDDKRGAGNYTLRLTWRLR